MSSCCGEKCVECGKEVLCTTEDKCDNCGEDKYLMKCSGCGAEFREHNCC